MNKPTKIIGAVVILAIIGGTVQYVRLAEKAYNTSRANTTTTSNSIQDAFESGINANNQTDNIYKKEFIKSCLGGLDTPSSQMESYCKCMSNKVIDTYGVKKASDMGLSMTQEQLIKEFTPLANQCISELGIQL